MAFRQIECFAFWCDPVTRYRLWRSCRCRRPRRPPRLFQCFRLIFPTEPERIPERAVIDPVSGAGPATISFVEDAVELPLVLDCCSQLPRLDCVQNLSCSKLELTLAEGEFSNLSQQFKRCRNVIGLKSCPRSPYSSRCWSSKRLTLCFCSAVDRVPRSLSLSSKGIQRWYAPMPRAWHYDWKCRVYVRTPKWLERQDSKANTTPRLSHNLMPLPWKCLH